MKANIYIGKDVNDKDRYVDLVRDKVNSIILAGETGSGKSVFHLNLYKQLIEQNNPEELGLVFFDMTQVDFVGWNSPFLLQPTTTGLSEDKPMDRLEELATKKHSKPVIIHIEECNLVVQFRKRFIKVWQDIRDNKSVYVVFSSSRIDSSTFPQELLDLTDMRIVFNCSASASQYLLNSDTASNFSNPGDRGVLHNSKITTFQPFAQEEVDSLHQFENRLIKSK